MALWLILLLSLCLVTTLKFLIDQFSHNKTKKTKPTNLPTLPPGPPKVPIFGHALLLSKYFSAGIGTFFHELRHKYGGIITLHIFSTPSIFISNHSLAHQALIQNGAALAHRPGPVTPSRVLNNNNQDLGSSSDARWRLFRKNLTSEILTSSRYKSFNAARKWALEIITEGLNNQIRSGEFVPVMEHIRYAMFCLLLFMCFGEKLDEKTIRDIEDVERAVIANFVKFNVFNLFPKVGKFVFRKTWIQLLEIRSKQESVLLPPIKSRRDRREKIKQENPNGYVASYVDSLFDLEITVEGGRKLANEEIVTLVSEFLDAGTDTVATVLEWVMAHLTKDQKIQEKLYNEIKRVVNSSGSKEVREEDLSEMKYLKAVVLEGLRLHPPGHFVLPHLIREDIVLDGHLIPKNALMNFMVAEMGRDPNVWKDPLDFKPERFMVGNEGEGEVVDITGSREIKMMPFSAGRRICPGIGLGTLHLEYFVASLIWSYKWTDINGGDDIDLTEKDESTTVMKNSLRARVSPR
ncbi:cytochrome P450 89A2-like [Telopea speciosissima]|uniref:cytochrome P450 89A2-like n=1 Tax=Telopea speciosissima TaxID=54955 RepID=UPI001CC5F45D|nr:cytochrome P450 89A2-like [Telopea speciosissima]